MRGDGGFRRHRWLLALCAWTLFVWVNRIRNVFAEDELVATDLVAPALFSAVALALAVRTLVLAGRRSADGGVGELGRGWTTVVVALAWIGSMWWLVRTIDIALEDWSVGFKVVHAVLAVVTVVLSVMTLRELGSGPLWVNLLPSSKSPRRITE